MVSIEAVGPPSGGAGAAVATFPRFVARAAMASASVPSSQFPWGRRYGGRTASRAHSARAFVGGCYGASWHARCRHPGLQRESAERLAAKCRVEKELLAVQDTNEELRATAENSAAAVKEARQGLVPVGELTAAPSSLSVAEKRITELERELKEAKAETSSAEGRVKAAVTSAVEERKVSDALVAALQNDLSALQNFIMDVCRPLIGLITDNTEEAQSYDARQCVTTLVDSAALSANCLRAYLQEILPTEVIPNDLVEVWHYLEKAPSVVEFMKRSAFCRGVAIALSLGLPHFPDDFNLDDVTSGYPSSTGSVEIADVLKLTERATVYSDRAWAMGDLIPYQETVVAPNDPEPAHHDFKVEQPFRAAMASELTTYPSNPWVPIIPTARTVAPPP